MNSMRIVAALHGYLGVLGCAALLHPAILLRSGKLPSRRGRWAIALSTLVCTLTFASGVFMYDRYRADIKRPLLSENLSVGLLFETKEHLAMLVVCLALGACLAALASPRQAVATRRVAALFYTLATLVALVVASLGTWVSAVRGF